jgi:lysozyme family protein
MIDFDTSVAVVLRHEGGLVDDPVDPGGLTNFGISWRWASANAQGSDFGHDGPAVRDDITNMTREQAAAIYRKYWWMKNGYDRLTDQDSATKVLDASVNMGPSQAHKLAQRAAGVADDGIFGPGTVASVNGMGHDSFLRAMCQQQAAFYRNLAAARPSLSKFLTGWLKRSSWPFPPP